MAEGPGRRERSFKLTCPRCQQGPGDPCVYTVHKIYGYDPEEVGVWRSQKEQTERVGKPMKVPHNERLIALYNRERRSIPGPLQSPTVQAAIGLAEREFEARERASLVVWLQKFGDLLTGE